MKKQKTIKQPTKNNSRLSKQNKAHGEKSKKSPKKPTKQKDSDNESFDEFDSSRDIYDSEEEESFDSNIEEELREPGESEQVNDSDHEQFQKQLEQELKEKQPRMVQTEEQLIKQESDGQYYGTDSILRPPRKSKKEKLGDIKFSQEDRKRIEEIQRIRLEKYLRKQPADAISLKTDDQVVSTKDFSIKLQPHETSSVAAEPSQAGNPYCDQSFVRSQASTSKVKIDNSDTKSIKSTSSQDPQLMSYLVNILSGNVSEEDLEFRKKQQEKRQKLQSKIKQLQKRKIQQKLKKQYDSRSQSQMKVLSTNMDTDYDKYEKESYHFSNKSEFGKLKSQMQEQNDEEEDPQQKTRKKRTRVTPEMLKSIIKDFEFVAKQQNGMVPHRLKMTFKMIGNKYALGRSSIMKMYSDYCKDPTMKSRFDSKQPMAHNRTMMQLTKRRITFIQKLIRKNCTLSQREIAAEMNMHDDLKCKRKRGPDQTMQEYLKNPYHQIAYKAVSRLMKIGNFTRKKVTLIPKNRNSERTIEERYNFCKILNELIADHKNKLYFLDQCRFNLFTSRDWGWAPKGQLATKIRHNSKGKDVMLLAIIGKEGLIGHEISDSYNRGSFTVAVNKLVNGIIPQNLPQGQRIYLILDNCPIHNKDNLKYLQSTLPLTILYLPPYSPMLNPIESWFGQLKRIIKSKIYKTRQAMKSELVDVLETFKNKSMDNYYKGIEKYIALGLKKELYRGNNKF